MIFSGAWLRGISPRVRTTLLGVLLAALLDSGAFARDAPSFWISNLEGKRFDSRRVGDEPFVLSFFFVNCQPCIREMPLLNSLMDERFPKVPLLDFHGGPHSMVNTSIGRLKWSITFRSRSRYF